MKTLTSILVLAMSLIACSRNDVPPPPVEQPLRNEVEMSFIGTEDKDKQFGFNKELSTVECRYSRNTNSLRVVAYQFVNVNGALEINESLQLTDYAIETSKSGFLKQMDGDVVPSFIFLSDQMNLKYTNQSKCSTYYEINGEEIKGNVLCSALESEVNDKTFVSLEFQCMNQPYLHFEIKQEML